jgi:hypothetical protein
VNQKLINEARTHVGYTAPPAHPDSYSTAVGQPGIPWAGAFLDVVIKRSGLEVLGVPSHVLTSTALARYISQGLIYAKPRPGDIVFFQSSTDPSQIPFGQPHVGLVTDVEHFVKHGVFKCIEGQTESGLPKGPAARNGVYERTRHVYDVVGFARPKYRKLPDARPAKDSTKPVPKINAGAIRLGLQHPSVVPIQLALAVTSGLRGAQRGLFDQKTRAAFANFQRSLGMIDDAASGIPDVDSLRILALRTGLFEVV